MIDDSRLRPKDYKVVLKILTFLTNPVQRNKNIDLIRQCSVLIKRTISEMNPSEVCLLSEVSKMFSIVFHLFLFKQMGIVLTNYFLYSLCKK